MSYGSGSGSRLPGVGTASLGAGSSSTSPPLPSAPSAAFVENPDGTLCVMVRQQSGRSLKAGPPGGAESAEAATPPPAAVADYDLPPVAELPASELTELTDYALDADYDLQPQSPPVQAWRGGVASIAGQGGLVYEGRDDGNGSSRGEENDRLLRAIAESDARLARGVAAEDEAVRRRLEADSSALRST